MTMDMLLELLTNPKPIQKRNGQSEPFQFEKLERSLTGAFQESGRTDEAVIREVIEAALQEVAALYARESSPTTDQVRRVSVVILEGKGLHDVKDRYEKEQKQPIDRATPPPFVSTAPSMSSTPSELPRVSTPNPLPVAGETYVARRRRLNEERKAITHKFQVGAYEGYLTVGLYDDGQPGEIFLRMNKEGSMLSGMMDSFATAISIGLQYGVPLKVFVKKFANVHFEPNGPTQNPNIPHARSIMDYVFRWLAVKFLTPEERQTVLGLHVDEPMMEQGIELSNVDGARQGRLLDGASL